MHYIILGISIHRPDIQKYLNLYFFYFLEEPEVGIDPLCYRANGFFNHEDPAVCDKYVFDCHK